jgi:acyl-CoA dehydrogenase
MPIDFSFPPELDELRFKVRDFMETVVRPIETKADADKWDRDEWIKAIIEMRSAAREQGLWLPHMPKEWGGMGLGHVAMAAVSAEAARTRMGPFALNAQAPDEGNMHTLLHWGTDEQKKEYLKPLCDGWSRSCFAMTEPEVAGSDPTLIQTRGYEDGDEWVINGHKWFISGARGAKFAILIARTEDDPELPQAANSAFIVDIPSDGWEVVRDIETMSGSHNHCEIRITDLRVHKDKMLGGRGQGHLLGQYRLGPARLAHCMRWIGQAETALEMMVDRSLTRYSHGSVLAEKQGIQWLIADSTIELYQCKLMVLHAAYLIDAGGNDPSKVDFRGEVSMTKHFVANSLWRIIDRAIQVHGALGYSSDTPLGEMLKQARWSRFADGADEIHLMRTAQRTIATYKDTGSTRAATGNLPI